MKRLLVFILLTFIYASVPGQERPDVLLKSVQSKYDSFNSLSVNFNKYSGTKEDFTGKLYLKKEDKLRLELKNNTIITDGKTIWNYDKMQKKVIINSYDESEPSEFSLHSFIYDYPSKCSISTGEEEGYKTLTLVPKTSELNFNSAKLYIADNNLVEKVIIDNQSGKSKIILSGYKLNPDIPDSEFTFSPPKGIKVIDLRS
jgi:outer membrane lipoprotein carrier protein